MRTRIVPFVVALGLLAATTGLVDPAGGAPGSDLRLNQMQVIGSHNSYHVEPDAATIQFYIDAGFPEAIELAYTHAPLAEQFTSQGVRQIELDVFADPAGDLWRPTGTNGFKVFHIEAIDMDATCQVFVDCLAEVKAWSDANPAHMPIAVLVELKDSDDFPVDPVPLPITADLLRDLDDEIRSVFPEDRLLTPDDVRGTHASVEDAILADGWPRIDDVRGQVMVLLDNKRDEYVDGDPTLAGRVAFPPSTPGQPDAAFIKRNDPTGANLAEIQALVDAGYVVRTRADGPVLTAQSGDTTQRDAALASGAQWVSTDYPIPGLATRWGTDYVAAIPGGTPARCNPVNAPEGCVSTDVEDLPAQVAPTTTTVAPTTTTVPPTTAAPAPVAVAAQPRFTG